MSGSIVLPLVDEGLANSAYLVELGGGRALAVDAPRDVGALRRVAERRGLSVAFAGDIHLHADFLTGALELAASDGAQVLAVGDWQYPHTPLRDGDEVDLGALALRVLATPGHTHEHVASEVLDGPRVLGVFTGGSLLVGSAARTDLVAPERTEELARAQYRSLQRLAGLDDVVEVWPTHSAGSFCSAPPGTERTSTIGRERATNALLRAESEDAFVEMLLASLGSYPPHFARLPELNRRGPALAGADRRLVRLDAAEVARLQAAGAQVVHVRPITEFSAGHVADSLSIPLRPAFATWLGWLVDAGRPLVVVRGADQDPEEIIWQALKIGYDDMAGELAGGMVTWAQAGRPVVSIPVVGPEVITDSTVLDVRRDSEFASGHVPGARHVELGYLPSGTEPVPAVPTVVMCGHGERAMGAASLLARGGRTDIAVLGGGPEEWASATGERLQAGG